MPSVSSSRDSPVRATTRRFPAVKMKATGQFVVIRANDKTLPDKCSCFICGETFAMRRRLKKHFSACAKKHNKDNDEQKTSLVEKSHKNHDGITSLLNEADVGVVKETRNLADPRVRGLASKKYIPMDQYKRDEESKIGSLSIEKRETNNQVDPSADQYSSRKRVREHSNESDQMFMAITHTTDVQTIRTIGEQRSKTTQMIKNPNSRQMSKDSDDDFFNIFRCPVCSAKFRNQIALLGHYKQHVHKDETTCSVSDEASSYRSFAKVCDDVKKLDSSHRSLAKGYDGVGKGDSSRRSFVKVYDYVSKVDNSHISLAKVCDDVSKVDSSHKSFARVCDDVRIEESSHRGFTKVCDDASRAERPRRVTLKRNHTHTSSSCENNDMPTDSEHIVRNVRKRATEDLITADIATKQTKRFFDMKDGKVNSSHTYDRQIGYRHAYIRGTNGEKQELERNDTIIDNMFRSSTPSDSYAEIDMEDFQEGYKSERKLKSGYTATTAEIDKYLSLNPKIESVLNNANVASIISFLRENLTTI